MSKFILTSQNNIEVGEKENKLQCAMVYSQIGCDLKYFNISIQVVNDELVNQNLEYVKNEIEKEFCEIFTKANEMGWDIFANIKDKLNK